MKTILTFINLYLYDIRHHFNDSHWNRLCGYSIMILFSLNITLLLMMLN